MSSLYSLSCFEVIKDTLDVLYHEMPEGTRDTSIRHKLERLRKEYRGLQTGGTVDYSDPATQFAYLYCYVTAHANLNYDLIRGTPELTRLFDEEEIRVSCLGGGPGSELLGCLRL